MKDLELTRQLLRIRTLIKEAPAASASRLELQSHWSRYLCILVAGFLETAIRNIYSTLALNTAQPAVASYAVSSLRKLRNPKADTFVRTAAAFSKSWAADLVAFLEEDGRKDAIDSIMSNRNLIAHGRDTSISLVRVVEYFDKGVDVVEYLEQQCGN